MHVSGFRRHLPVPAVVVPQRRLRRVCSRWRFSNCVSSGVVGRQQGQFGWNSMRQAFSPKRSLFGVSGGPPASTCTSSDAPLLLRSVRIVRPDDVHLVVMEMFSLLVAVAVLVAVWPRTGGQCGSIPASARGPMSGAGICRKYGTCPGYLAARFRPPPDIRSFAVAQSAAHSLTDEVPWSSEASSMK